MFVYKLSCYHFQSVSLRHLCHIHLTQFTASMTQAYSAFALLLDSRKNSTVFLPSVCLSIRHYVWHVTYLCCMLVSFLHSAFDKISGTADGVKYWPIRIAIFNWQCRYRTSSSPLACRSSEWWTRCVWFDLVICERTCCLGRISFVYTAVERSFWRFLWIIVVRDLKRQMRVSAVIECKCTTPN